MRGGEPLQRLNELEWVDGWALANVFVTGKYWPKIFEIRVLER